MHVKTQGLVLRETNYKEADKILTVLTREGGKRTVKARGCRRKNSPLAASAQLLVWSDMTLFAYRDRLTLNEAEALELFWGVRADVEKLALASYFAEVTEAVAEEGRPDPALLSLTLNSLYALDKLQRPLPLVKAAFELKLLCVAGYEPLLDACAVCGRAEPRGAPAGPDARGSSTAPPAAWETGAPGAWTPPVWPPCATWSTGTPSGSSPSPWRRPPWAGWPPPARTSCSSSWTGASPPWIFTAVSRRMGPEHADCLPEHAPLNPCLWRDRYDRLV